MTDDWRAFELDEEITKQLASGRPYREFLRVPSMSLGLYTLAVGDQDPQRPHTEDEVYYCLRGRARLRVGGDDYAVAPGSLHFVPKAAEHRFHSITEDLRLLVFFAPAEGSAGGSP